MKPGNKVCFTAAVIRRSGHDSRIVNMWGTILEIRGNVARVDCHGTYSSEDGNSVRVIPLANLCRWSDALGLFVDNE